MDITINLDKFKNMFKRCIDELDTEVGFNMHYNVETKNISFEIIKGNETSVTIPYDQVIVIHTHPKYLYETFDYQPPSNYDYSLLCSDYYLMKKKPINIVLEKKGIWFYKMTDGLIKEIEDIRNDDIKNGYKFVYKSLTEDEIGRNAEVSDQFFNLNDVVNTNTSNEGINLNYFGENIKRIVHDFFIVNHLQEHNITDNDKIKLVEKNLKKNLKNIDYNDIISKYNLKFKKISIDDYLHNMNNILTDDLGFDVKFVPWTEPFDVTFELNDNNKNIFDDIKKRNFNKFTEDNRDGIVDILKDYKENKILKYHNMSRATTGLPVVYKKRKTNKKKSKKSSKRNSKKIPKRNSKRKSNKSSKKSQKSL